MSESVLPIFSSKGFIVSHFTFKYAIHLELIFVYSFRECYDFIILHIAVHFSHHRCLKRLFIFIIYSSLICHGLIDHKCMSLFLGFLSCSIDLDFCFCAYTILF